MRFAHLADVHLGFQRQEPLQEIERRVFEGAVDRCIAEEVDFVLVCGDLFHVNIPDMRVQKMAMKKFHDMHDAGIPAYAVYGSHDFSPTSSSAIDLLEAAGYLRKVTVSSWVDDHIRLEYIQDERTGALIAGLSGLKAGRDMEYYERLDREFLESANGFRIFLFHGAVGEMMQDEISGESLPLSYMPRGLDYYAGGHLHTFRNRRFPGYENVVYPGTLFAGQTVDMEENARGMGRGFVMVDFGDKVERVRFVEAPGCRYELIDVDADGLASEEAAARIRGIADSIDADGKVVILKTYGELGSGRTADIDFSAIRKGLLQGGAYYVMIHRRGLTSKEYKTRGESMGTREEIERRTFQDSIADVRIKRAALTGSRGVDLSTDLLAALRHPRPDNEKKVDYERRVTADATSKMGLE
ncbi:MAG: metallophosphoesterase [Thaumarchaeota archaeon]|nr:metallophosphoesterase [Nitrososphaerota archaeon]